MSINTEQHELLLASKQLSAIQRAKAVKEKYQASNRKPSSPDLPMVYSLLIKGHLLAKENTSS
jgi:hypothetical protein